MSKYTTEVRWICEHYSGVEECSYSNINDIIQKAIPYIFDFDFPIFDSEYRNVLLTKILKHYYTREIGEETVSLWKFRLDTRLNEIMPYYNQLYKSELLEFNPFYDVEISREHTNKVSGETTDTKTENVDKTNNGSGKTTDNGSNNHTGNEKELYSDTPQGAIDNLESETYLTNATKNIIDRTDTNNNIRNTEYADSGTTKTNSDYNSVVSNTEEYLEKICGKQGTESYASLLVKYRETFLNIDTQIINELSDLFLNLW